MFGFFKSKKKQEAAKRAEKHDSFYRESEEEEDDFVDDQGMDDEEYGRRVTEEIAKRKSAARASPSVSAAHSPASRGLNTPTSRATNSPGTVPTPPPSAASHASKVTATAVSSQATSKMKSVPLVTATVVPNPKKQTTAARPNPATAAPIIPEVNTSKSNPTTPTATHISASRPYSATSAPVIVNPSRPNAATTPPLHIAKARTGGFTPDPKAMQQLVSMGFSYPAANMALRMKENRADQAAEYLLEHSDAEINSLLAIESAQRANAVKKGDNAHPVTSKPATSSTPVAVASSINVAASSTKSTANTITATTSSTISSKDVNKTSTTNSNTSPITEIPSLQRINSKKNVVAKEVNSVDAAMAAIIAKREALKKKQAQVVKQSSQKNVKTNNIEENTTETTANTTATTTTTTTSSTAVYDKLSNYKTKGTVVRELQEEEDRLRIEGQEKRRKALAAPVTDSAVSVLASPDSASSALDDNHTGTGSISTEPSESITTTPVVQKERSSRQSNTSPRRATSNIGLVEEEKSARKTDPSPRRSQSSSNTTSTTTSSAFEVLYNKKTEKMLLIEQLEAEERAEKEAQERKWKKLTAKTDSTTASRSNSISENDVEVFEKLYSKPIESQKLGEKSLLEEKLHKEKLEAHISGKAGIALQASENKNILKKTESARMREYETMEERKRFEEEERRKKELEPTPILSPSRPPMSRRSSSVDRMRLSSEERSEASMARRLSSSLDSISMVEVQEEGESDTESPTTEQPNPAGKQHSTAQLNNSTSRQNSFREDSNTNTTENNQNNTILSKIPGIIKRTLMNYKVTETSDHRWEGRVNVPNKETVLMVPIKGSYASKQQCIQITTANTPPQWKIQSKLSCCSICEESFNKYLKAENCRNCGQLVCPDCSDETWPSTMIPVTFYEKNSLHIRICSACIKTTNSFIAALRSGDLETVQCLYKYSNVNLHLPYSILPDAPYPIHCAAASGNVTLLRWLVEEQGCCTTDASTGAPLVNASGHSILAVAARRGDRDMMQYAIRELHCSTADITDVAILQRGLHAALEASGPLPSLTLKKHSIKATPCSMVTAASVAATSITPATAASALSLKRIEKLPVSTDEPATESLLLKAAEITSRLKVAPLSRTPSAAVNTTTSSNSDTVKTSAPSKPSLSKTKSTVVTPPRKTTIATSATATTADSATAVADSTPAAATVSAATAVLVEASIDDDAVQPTQVPHVSGDVSVIAEVNSTIPTVEVKKSTSGDVQTIVDQATVETETVPVETKEAVADTLTVTPIVDAEETSPVETGVTTGVDIREAAAADAEVIAVVDAPADTEVTAAAAPADTEETAEIVDAPANTEKTAEIVDAPADTEETAVVDVPADTDDTAVVDAPAAETEETAVVNAPADTEETAEIVDAPAETEDVAVVVTEEQVPAVDTEQGGTAEDVDHVDIQYGEEVLDLPPVDDSKQETTATSLTIDEPESEAASTTIPTAADTTTGTVDTEVTEDNVPSTESADTTPSKNLADIPTVRIAPSVPKNKTFITGTRRMSSTKMEPPEETTTARMSMPGGSRTNSWRVDNTSSSNGSSNSSMNGKA